MDFTYSQAFDGQISDAYERLLLDAMLGDGTLFLRRDDEDLVEKTRACFQLAPVGTAVEPPRLIERQE